MLVSDIIKEVKKIATERPEIKYLQSEDGGCYYGQGECSDGSVGCIFGQALVRLGVDVSKFDTNYRPDIEYEYVPSITDLIEGEGHNYGEEEYKWCREVQNLQDNGLCWGDAVQKADNSIKLS